MLGVYAHFGIFPADAVSGHYPLQAEALGGGHCHYHVNKSVEARLVDDGAFHPPCAALHEVFGNGGMHDGVYRLGVFFGGEEECSHFRLV